MRKTMTTTEAAEILGMTAINVAKLVRKGVIKGEKVGRDYALDPASVRSAKTNRPRVGRPKGK